MAADLKAANTGSTGAPNGYAASRRGEMGAMFGGSERPSYDLGLGYHSATGGRNATQYASNKPAFSDEQWAPGSADLYAGSHSRDLALSDPSAKREAYLLGRAHQMEHASTGQPVPFAYGGPPKEGEKIIDTEQGVMSGPRGRNKPAPERKASTNAVRKADPSVQQYLTAESEAAQEQASGPSGWLRGADIKEQQRHVEALQEHAARQRIAQAVPVAPTLVDPPPQMALSDERTKKGVHHFGGPMADANRSMEPSSYEYKPEFLPPEQKPGEKNIGPMADKMARDPVASTAIVKDPETGMLAIDKTKGLKLVMGSLASLQRQVDHMEGARR